jgi:hypothetical protein
MPEAMKTAFRAVILGTAMPPKTTAVTGAEIKADAIPIINPESIDLIRESNILTLIKPTATIAMTNCVPI